MKQKPTSRAAKGASRLSCLGFLRNLRLARRAPSWCIGASLLALLTPAWAALPTITAPTSGIGSTSCAGGDIMCYVGAYFKEYIGIVAVVVAALFLIAFALGSFSKWRAYSAGREDVASLKEFMFLGAIVSGVVVLLAYLAVQYAT